MGSYSRRGFLGLAGTTALVSAVAVSPFMSKVMAAGAPVHDGIMPVPGPHQRPMFRWWWPGGYIEPEEVAKEVYQMADAGFGGFEIADVRDGVTGKLPPKIYGWGTQRWCDGVEAALLAADKRGMRPDITIGAHWPTGMPGVVPDSPAAAQELVHAAFTLKGGESFNGALPVSHTEPSGISAVPKAQRPKVTPKLLAVLAYRSPGMNGESVVLDLSSCRDLTKKVSGGRLNWTAPQGNWHVLVFWTRGTGQIQGMFQPGTHHDMLADPIPFVVDIFGKAGAQACMDFWDKHLLPPRTRKLLGKLGGHFFEDSLELKAVQHWSPDMVAEFKARRGYDMIRYLPLLAVKPGQRGVNPLIKVKIDPPYVIKGVNRDYFLDDFNKTLGEMYVDNRLKPIDAWAKTMGMGFRAQCIGGIVDSGNAAAHLSIPEGDNACNMDAMRVLAAGRDIGGKKILSCETTTFVGGQAYVANWRTAVFMMQRDCAGGVNQLVIHGFDYLKSPKATWPGYDAFGRAIGNCWGPRSPQWAMATQISPYLARLTEVLQKGRSLTDVAILYQKTGVNAVFKDEGLRMAGYTYQFPDRELLDHPNMVVADKVLAPKGPAYKAFVVNQEKTMDVHVASRILDFARAGLPVFVIGDFPQKAAVVEHAAAEAAKLHQLVAELKALSNVRVVAGEAALPAALKQAGIAPSFGFSKKSRLTGLRRHASDADYYYLLNDTDGAMALTVSVPAGGVPYLLDMWSGKITPVAVYKVTGGKIRVPLDFHGNEVKILIVSSRKLTPDLPKSHIVRAGGGEWLSEGARLMVRATKPGSYKAALAGGASVAAVVKQVPAVQKLNHWSLKVEDWRPGKTAYETKKLHHTLTLKDLKPWSEIEELKTVSGIGRYETTVTLDHGWTGDMGAILELGYVNGTYRVEVNGKAVPPLNQFLQQADIGPYLKPGTNHIAVIVATTLDNRLIAEGISSNFDKAPGTDKPVPVEDLPAPDPLAPPTGKYFEAPHGRPGPVPMLPGAADPGGKRWEQDYGMHGPVIFRPYCTKPAA